MLMFMSKDLESWMILFLVRYLFLFLLCCICVSSMKLWMIFICNGYISLKNYLIDFINLVDIILFSLRMIFCNESDFWFCVF